jgi:hypothetical protein
MKSIIRIPTTQYGYIETEFEGTAEQAIEEHNRILLLYNGGFGLETKEFNAALDRYLSDGTGETEVYLKMSKEQRAVFQEIKKSLKRIEAKNT